MRDVLQPQRRPGFRQRPRALIQQITPKVEYGEFIVSTPYNPPKQSLKTQIRLFAYPQNPLTRELTKPSEL